MLGLLTLMALGLWVLLYQRPIDDAGNELPSKMSSYLDKLWGVAQESINDQRYLRAEKALLTILRVDERNATAYNRLGILYAKQRAYQDAIECFEIAQSLESSASSLHNVGLIYFETGAYDKAALAFIAASSPAVVLELLDYVAQLEKDAGRWRMLPAFLEDHQIDYVRLVCDIDTAMESKHG
jgi:tetratricopeptide (TPR) repeat protein